MRAYSACVCFVMFLLATAAHGTESDPKPTSKALLVIAPERFTPALEAFVKHKRTLLPTDLVTLEQVLKEAPGTDDPERIKHFVFDRWRSKNLGYVLLVGDADVMPVRYMVLDRVTPEAFDYAFYPSDLYYADLADRRGQFDDWNAQKDGFHARYFGEVRGEKNKTDPINFDAIDYRPEIAVGRWPVSTLKEVETVAAKSIRYEQEVVSNRAPGLRTAAFFAVAGWVDCRAFMDGLAGRLPEGWKTAKRYDQGPRSKQKQDALPPSEAQFAAVFNDGASLIFHAGHGHDGGWERSGSVATLPRLKNADRLPVVLSAGCSTARLATLPPYEAYRDIDGKDHKGTNFGEVFKGPPPPPSPYQSGAHNPTGMGEQLLRAGPNGAIAYIGCNTGSQPCGLTLLDGFSRALQKAGTEPRLGDCWASAISHYHDAEHLATIKPTPDWYPASIFFQAMKFMLYGDPSLRLPGPAHP